MSRTQHERWMRRALELAAKGRFSASPNPLVGACVVKNGKLVSEGFHARFGGDHAEAAALKKAGKKARGAVLYVSLEPCSSWGKTPPCVTAVIESGVREVVIGTSDPNPVNFQKGTRALRRAGIRVTAGVLEKEAQEQNAAFFKWIKTGLPYITLKMAQSLDGKIASSAGRSRWISSPGSRKFVHELRAEQDAVLVGKNTLRIDNPFLSPRIRVPNMDPSKPWRIALNPELPVRPSARIFKGEQNTLLAIPQRKAKSLSSKHKIPAAILPVPEKNGSLDLRELCRSLGKFGIAKLLVEGGGETAWSFLKEGLVDKACWIVAPKILGGRGAKTSVEGPGFSDPNHPISLSQAKVTQLGEDWLFEFVPEKK